MVNVNITVTQAMLFVVSLIRLKDPSLHTYQIMKMPQEEFFATPGDVHIASVEKFNGRLIQAIVHWY